MRARMLIVGLMVAIGCSKSQYKDLDELLEKRRNADGGMDSEPDGGGCEEASLGEGCLLGEGQCERDGVWACEAGEPVCTAEPGTPRDELCGNDKDEDCDGTVDEAPEGACCSDDDCDDSELCQRDERYPFEPGRCTEQDAKDDCDGADLQVDVQNCGACGRKCDGEDLCEAGECVPPCRGADLAIDDDNCGACGKVCAADESCVDSACEPDPPDCGGADLMTDTANCGSCGHECEADETCEAGECEPPCGGADFMTDEKNCGTCGESCASEQRCAGGSCVDPVPLASGTNHTCGLLKDGTPVCWGWDADGRLEPPPGKYVVLGAAADHTCAIKETDGLVACWGKDIGGATAAPSDVPLTSLSVAAGHACGIDADRELVCWGSLPSSVAPPPGEFSQVAAGGFFTCGIQASDQTVRCWGTDLNLLFPGEVTPTPAGAFSTISAAGNYMCGVRKSDATVLCWGAVLDPPPVNLMASQVSASADYSCALRSSDHNAQCWGDPGKSALDAPGSPFRWIDTGPSHACGIRDDGQVDCWGENPNGQRTAPRGLVFGL